MPETLRPADISDAKRLWEWRNDDDARRASLNTEPVPWERHLEWLTARLHDPATRLLVLEVNGVPAGQARLDVHEDEAELSFALAPDFRGRGLGAVLVERAAGHACAQLGVRAVRAIAKAANVRSLKAFERAGFERAGEETIAGAPCIHFRRECA